MAENYSDISPFNYVFSNPLSFIDPSGMTPDQASDGYSNIDTRNTSGSISYFSFGGQGMSSDDPAKKKVVIVQNPGAMQSIPDFLMSDGPSYSQMSPFRRGLNDFANSSFMTNINEWNPLYNGANAVSGFFSGKNLYGGQM